ncbi:MAG: hypothetical protein JWM11_4114 [Planctomycetaceae bacterium]|nr:hypothetical protein [Planctomycetaceae bacterium]
MLSIGDNLNDVAGQEGSLVASAVFPMQDNTTFEVAATANQCQPLAQRFRFAVPESNDLIWPHDPLAVSSMQLNRDAAESPAPFNHG